MESFFLEEGKTRALGRLGTSAFFLLVFGVPLFFLPPSEFQIRTVTSEIVLFKHLALRFVCSGIFLVAAAQLFLVREKAKRLLTLPSILLLAYVGWMLLSAATCPSPGLGVKRILSECALILATMLAGLFLTNEKRVRVVLYGATAATVILAVLGLLARWGWGDFLVYVYGGNPVEIAKQGLQHQMGRVEGGSLRSAFIGTIGNVEYAGHYMAGGFLLAGCWVLDGWGSRHNRSMIAWLAGLAAMAILGLAVVLTATRGALVVIAMGMLVRWWAGMPLRGWKIAVGGGVVVFAGLLLGFWFAVIAVMLGCALTLGWQLKAGHFLPIWQAIEKRTQVILIAGAAGAVLVATMFVVPGPWKVHTFQIADRFASATTTSDRSVRERLTFYLLAGTMALEHPVFGVGPGHYPAEFHRTMAEIVARDASGAMAYNQRLLESGVAANVHNDYFQIAAERGLPALFLFLGAMSALFGGLVRIVRQHEEDTSALAHAIVVVLAGYMTMMLTSFPLQEGARLATFYAIVACGVALLTHFRSTEIEN